MSVFMLVLVLSVIIPQMPFIVSIMLSCIEDVSLPKEDRRNG